MGKRKATPSYEEHMEVKICYYCEKFCPDDSNLLTHMRAAHLKCDHCGKRQNTIGGLRTHVHNVHKTTVDVINNAIPGRENAHHSPEIYAMVGFPEDLRAQLMAAHANEYFIKYGYPADPSEPQVKKVKVEETLEQKIARRDAHIIARREARAAAAAAAEAAARSVTPEPTVPSAAQSPKGKDTKTKNEAEQVCNDTLNGVVGSPEEILLSGSKFT